MAKKFYAVKKGQKPGIYDSWPKAQEQIKGFSKAEFKGFNDLAAAEAYLTDSPVVSEIQADAVVYTDGSYNPATGAAGFAFYIEEAKTPVDTQAYLGQVLPALVFNSRNIAGECQAVIQAITWAISQNYQSLEIRHDYLGVARWIQDWKASSPVAQTYVAEVTPLLAQIEVSFTWVKGHAGEANNEIADSLAKVAAGVGQPKDNLKNIKMQVL